jgi:phosphoglycolate phosphatase
VLSETGVTAADAVMIGDTSYDMKMAKAAGLHAIGVSWGYHDRSALSAADLLIDDFSELPDALNRILETVT